MGLSIKELPTVGALVKELQTLPQDIPLALWWDSGLRGGIECLIHMTNNDAKEGDVAGVLVVDCEGGATLENVKRAVEYEWNR